MALSSIRDWLSTYKLGKSDTNDSDKKDEQEEFTRRNQLSKSLNRTLRTRQVVLHFDAGRPILSLKAPADLVNFPSISRPRWPIECEVISDIIHHIEWDPPEPEPLYQLTGHEKTPMVDGEERGKVVYCIDQATKHPYFTCSRVGGSTAPIKSATFDIAHTGFILEFESRFESGNLQKAVQVEIYDYELTLRTDMYTKKHTQWFYFRVRNMKAGVTYRFTIVNLMKCSSLYARGMRPICYSERAAKEKGIGWQHTGSNIKYYRNCSQDRKDENIETVALYSLTWTHEFPYDSDTCYLAHCYPYTYSHLQHYLGRISSNTAVVPYCKLRVLCHSLAGNAIYVLTITSPDVSRVEDKIKKVVVVTARVHPGETNASWMMEGFLDYLLGDSEDAQILRDNFVFKVVPMLNPDGVIVGNYRCSLAGRDLNRNYKTLLRDSFPCVWHIRNMVKRLVAETDVALYCDFHGHNRKHNVFMYGCSQGGKASLNLHERVFPLMMSKNASNEFSFKSCKFGLQKSKEGTGRIAMWKLGIKNSYTIETTFGGSTLGDRKGTHFTTRDLKSFGFYFCDTLLDYYDPDPAKKTYCLTELTALLRKQAKEKLGKDLSTDRNISVSDLESSTSGSNSSDSDGLPAHLLYQTQTHSEQSPERKKKGKCLKSLKERNRLHAKRTKKSKVLQNNIDNIESNLSQDTTLKDGIQENPVQRLKRKDQVNDVVTRSTTNSGEVSQVTLWQACEPLKDKMVAKCLFHRAKACSYLSCSRAVLPHTDGPRMDVVKGRCCAQLLNPSTLVIHSNPQEFRHSSISHKAHRATHSFPGTHRSPSSIHLTMVPHSVHTKRFPADKLNSHNIFSDRNSSGVSKCYAVPEDSNTSHPDKTKSRQQSIELEKYSPGALAPMWSTPIGEQDQRDLKPVAEPHSSVFMPVLRDTDQRQLQCKMSSKDKSDMDALWRLKTYRRHQDRTSASLEQPR